MTFDPGACDVFTTSDPPFPPEADDALLAGLLRRAMQCGYRMTQYGSGPWYFNVEFAVSDEEMVAIRRIWEGR